MKNRKYIIGILVFVFSALGVQAQFYNTGQDRGSLKWLQIKTEHFKVIYPVESDSIARHMAKALQWSYDNITHDMDHQPRKIGVIIHPEASESNGIVTWAPKRMEIFTTPPMDAYPHDWFEQLALHEYRHVIQIDKMNQGITRFLFFLFGEQAVGGVLGAYIPLWFLEGDAVYAETQFSATGRGREVSFLEDLKVQVLDTGIYHMDKAVYGSYKDFVPGPYELGYAWVSEVNRQYGDSVWPNVLNYVARRPFLIIPFTLGLNKQTGLHRLALYNSVMDTLQGQWMEQSKASPPMKQQALPMPAGKKDYAEYILPTHVDSTTALAIKQSFSHIPRLVKIYRDEEGNIIEEKLRSLGYSYFYNLGFNGQSACWSEFRFDPRWDHRRFNVIMTYDLKSGKSKQITQKTNYFFPEYHPKGHAISCLEIDPYNHYALVIIDAQTGAVIKKHTLPHMIASPLWDAQGEHVYFVGQTAKGHSLARISVETGAIEELLAPDYFTKDIQWIAEDSIYFTAEYEGAENLFAYVISEQKMYQFTQSAFGLMDFCQRCNGEWLYTYPDILGRKIYQANPNDFQARLIQPRKTNDSLWPILERNIQFDSLPQLSFSPTKYHKGFHLLNLHSWGPIAINGTSIEPNPSLSVSSQNLLGTSTLQGQHIWDIANDIRTTSIDYSYEGWYPEMNIGYSYIYQNADNDILAKVHLVSSELSLPLQLTRSRAIKTFFPYIGLRWQKGELFQKLIKRYDETVMDAYLGFRFRMQSRQARRDIRPRWGMDLRYMQAWDTEDLVSSMWYSEAYWYVPGLLKHHSLRLYSGVQFVDNAFGILSYSNLVDMPRGQFSVANERMYSLKADYAFPVAHPDFSLGPVFYTKRIRMNLFADYFVSEAKLSSNTFKQVNTLGVDLVLDGHAFRLITPVSIGLRSMYINQQDFGFQLLFELSIP
jgi:hypothetical protein